MNAFKENVKAHSDNIHLRRMTGLVLCFCCVSLPALAGQSLVWNGADTSGTIGEIRLSPWRKSTLYPDNPSGNTVTINGDLPIYTDVYGGADSQIGSAAAANNRVIINNGSIYDSVVGSRVSSDSGSATATGNSVTINGGTSNTFWGAYVHSNSGSATATGNSVTVNGGTVNGNIYGSEVNSPGGARAAGNSVTVNGGTVNGDIAGSKVTSDPSSATAIGNSVTLNGGSVDRNVYGGFASNIPGSATATGNSVTLNGGWVGRNVYGGFASSDYGSARATGNSITLSGSLQFAQHSRLYGGENGIMSLVIGDAFSGNTLNVWNYTGSAVAGVQNFQHYNFLLPSTIQNGGTLLTVTNTAVFDDSKSSLSTGVKSSITGVNILSGGTALQAGDSITLMSYATLVNNAYAINGNDQIQGQKGISLLYDFQLSQNDKALKATVKRVRVHPQTKALSEGRLAGLAFINQGADLIAGTGMDAARQSISHPDQNGLTTFIAFQGGSSRYDSGSHIDLDGYAMLAGLAGNRKTDMGNILLGAFVEAGWGSYDSYNSFNSFTSVHGKGDTNYWGVGTLGRFDFMATGLGKPYAEASLRVGRIETDFSSSDFRAPLLDQKVSYDSDSTYYGAHLGLGYIWNTSEFSNLDIYAKYFWTHQDNEKLQIVNAPIHFKTANSHRVRVGVKYNYTLNTENGYVITPYIGLSGEREFDGKAGATTYGYSINKPKLAGNTGIGELGISLRPSATSNISLNLDIQGYTGTREGVSGSMQAKWMF